MRSDVCGTSGARIDVRRRRAMTLLEVMASISVLLIIGVSAASILGKVTDIGAQNSQSQQSRQSVRRLSGVLRRDVRLAQEVNLAGDNSLIELLSDGQVIRYTWSRESGDLMRQSEQDGVPMQFDRFRLPPNCRPTARATGAIVALEVKQEGQPHPWIIEALRP